MHSTTILGCLLACAGAALGADDSSQHMLSEGLVFSAVSPAADVYRIDVQPMKDNQAVDRTKLRGGTVAGAGQASLTLDQTRGVIILKRGESALWYGRVSPLNAFGQSHVPGLELSWEAADGEVIYGLGERFDGLNQYGKKCEMWIRDTPAGGPDGRHSYFCTPVLFSSRGYALLAADNPEGEFDLNYARDGKHRYRRAGQTATFYLIAGESLKDLVLKRGKTQGPFGDVPDWAWGPWISRNSYETQAEAEAVIKEMVQRRLPVAAIVQEAWKGHSESGDFNNFSSERWPDPDGYFELCKANNIKTILWQVPVLHPSSPQYREAKKNGYLVKAADGSVSLREHWLEGFANIDFTLPDAVKWWKDLLRPVVRKGIAGFKADDGEAIKPGDVFADGRQGWQVHNEYSTLYNKCLSELLAEEHVNGMLWARSGSLGIERFPALWAGDEHAEWRDLRTLIPAGLSASISGMPFWSHDIGGYAGTPTPELYIRWLQFGTFSPLMQYHGVTAREPWEFGPEAEQAYRLLAQLRMNLRPTLIALGQQAAKTGLPMMRPMALEFPDDSRFATEETQYMLGSDLLVAPVLEAGAAGRMVRFPTGRWHDLLQPVAYDGPADVEVPIALDSAPVYVRDGAKLSVELDPGAKLGQWRRGVPIRELEFAHDRASIVNLRAPIFGNALTRQASVKFEVAPDVQGDLFAVWVHRGTALTTQRAPIAREGAKCGLDLTIPPERDVTDTVQTYQIRSAKDSRETVLFQGEIHWAMPVALEVQTAGSRVLTAGKRDVTTLLTNRSDQTVNFSLFVFSDASMMMTGSRDGTLGPRQRLTWEWPIEFAPVDFVGVTPVHFVVSSAGRQAARTSIEFTRPSRWAVVGPFHAARRAAHRTAFPPEWSTDPQVAFEFDRNLLCWTQLPADHLDAHGGIDFRSVFGSMRDAAGYAMTRIRSDAARDVELRFGSDDTLAVWLNGQRIYSVETYRSAAPDQEIVKAHLVEGVNTLAAKVAQDVGDWKLLMRVTDIGGQPPKGLSDGFDDFDAYAPKRTRFKKTLGPAAPMKWGIAGPFPNPEKNNVAWRGPLDDSVDSQFWPPQVEGVDWKWPFPESDYDGTLDFRELLGSATNSIAYAACTLYASDAVPIEIVCGSDDGLVVWLNGKKIVDANAWREFRFDADRVRAELQPGENRLLAKIGQGTGPWLFRLEVWDASELPYKPYTKE